MIIAATIIILIAVCTLSFTYCLLKGLDRISRPGVDPRHDDVDPEVVKKMRGDK